MSIKRGKDGSITIKYQDQDEPDGTATVNVRCARSGDGVVLTVNTVYNTEPRVLALSDFDVAAVLAALSLHAVPSPPGRSGR